MAVPEFRTGDTWPPLTGTVTDGAGNPVAINTASSVRMVALLQPGATVITGTTVIVDDGTAPNKGKWSYTWGASDLSAAGTYEVEIEVTWSAGKIQTFPSDKGRAATFKVTADND